MKKFLLTAIVMLASFASVNAQEVTPPAQAQIEVYSGSSYSYAIFNYVEWEAQVAVAGNQMYINNIFPNIIKTKWVVGTINGDKVVFAGGQVIGDQDQVAMGGDMYFTDCMLYGLNDDFEFIDATFSWDEDNKIIKSIDVEVASAVNWTDEDGKPMLAMNDGFDGTSDPTATFTLVGTGKTTAVKDINVKTVKAVKTLENGQVVIVKDGVRYNVMGQKL